MIRILLIVANVLAGLCLAAVAALLILESTWKTKEPSTPADYFMYGSTGTELIPLPVLKILPDLFSDQFQPRGPLAGDWVDQFGFVRGQPGVNEGLPVGMNVSYYRPRSGAPSPVAFVGFNCAMCHTGRIIRAENDPGVVVSGMANPALDLVAFGDAIKTSVLDEKRLSLATIIKANDRRGGKPLGMLDRLMIVLWLEGTRAALKADLPLRGAPYSGPDLCNSALMPSGPGRNEPMRETVRFLIDQTPEPDGGPSKIPCLYEQERRIWAQYDGSVRDPDTRNSLAALGVGATLDNLRVPGILHTIEEAYSYLRNMPGPKYATVFPAEAARLDPAQVERGHSVYEQYCADCHGAPGATRDTWVNGNRQGVVVPITELGTDPARVTFRFYPGLAQVIYDFFPPGHPLKPKREDIRPNPGDPVGLITSPLESIFSRAPYLHNGSVPILAQLINLEARPAVFYRGLNLYDPAGVGLLAPNHPDAARYFEYRTDVYGNSNRGHDYPWPYHGPGWNEDALKDLLEYLKTI